MHLKPKDVAELLQVPESTVLEWVKTRRIPCHRIGRQFHFNRDEINEWILTEGTSLRPRLLELSISGRATRLADLITLGGVHRDVAGDTIVEVLQGALSRIPLPAGVTADHLLSALIDREAMVTTAIGRGIAVPHPRHPIVATMDDAAVSVCYLSRPVAYGALDGEPVHTLLFLLSHSPRRHLEVLSKLSFLCQDPAFTNLLKDRATAQELVQFVRDREADWTRGGCL